MYQILVDWRQSNKTDAVLNVNSEERSLCVTFEMYTERQVEVIALWLGECRPEHLQYLVTAPNFVELIIINTHEYFIKE
jgi:hypothetical protein